MKPQVIKQSVGIDLSKDDFKVCLWELLSSQKKRIKGSRTFKNTLVGFKAFVAWLKKRQQAGLSIHVTLEATGVYYEQLVHFLHQNTELELRLSVILPNMAKAYCKSLNQKSKTDRIDAKLLGQMGLERDLPIWKPLSPNIFLLKQLTRDRVSLIREKTMLANKLHALKHSFNPNRKAIKRLNSRLKLLAKQIKEVEKEIAQVAQADQVLYERIEKICKIKGIGLVTVVTIIAETNGFANFTSRTQLTSYAGYDVVHQESGTSVNRKTRISKKGNAFIRRALHFPALTVVKSEPSFKQLYQRVFERTAIKMKGYVAVQRKLLLIIYTLFKKNEAYDPNYHKSQILSLNQENRQDAPACAQ